MLFYPDNIDIPVSPSFAASNPFNNGQLRSSNTCIQSLPPPKTVKAGAPKALLLPFILSRTAVYRAISVPNTGKDDGNNSRNLSHLGEGTGGCQNQWQKSTQLWENPFHF
jgi:hypothetical protein